MTDNDIIKALECCGADDCTHCPFFINEEFGCDVNMEHEALDLIKRQKAENESLTQRYTLAVAEREANVKGFTEQLQTAKAEAAKEFALRLEDEMGIYYIAKHNWIGEIIDNLVKEMGERIMDNRCVSCGEIIPEGRMVCPNCEVETKPHTTEDFYLEFRRELDKIWVPILLENTDCIEQITYNGKPVGIICGTPTYIDCVYVMPEYRKKGIAKKAVLEYYERYGADKPIRVHIINNNTAALKFWNALFKLKPIAENLIDTLYEIEGRVDDNQ